MSDMRPPNAPAPRRASSSLTTGSGIASVIRGVNSSLSTVKEEPKYGVGPQCYSLNKMSTANGQAAEKSTPLGFRLDPLNPASLLVPDSRLLAPSPCLSDVSCILLPTPREVPPRDPNFPPIRQTDNWSRFRVLPPVSARGPEAEPPTTTATAAPNPPFPPNPSSNSLSPYNMEASPSTSSLASRNPSAHSYNRSKKRPFSISPLSIEDMDRLIRTSPTSLVAYINSQSSSPLLFGSQGHLTAARMSASPSSRGGSSSGQGRRRGSGQSDPSFSGTMDRNNQNLMQCIMDNQMLTTAAQTIYMAQFPPDLKTEPGGAELNQSPARVPPLDVTVKTEAAAPGSQQPGEAEDDLTEPPTPAEDGEVAQERVCRWVDCDSGFNTQDELVRHIEKAHIDQRRGEEFTCYWVNCPRQCKPFNARYKLLIHMRVHSGERPNKCTFEGCKKAFSRLENLKIHLRSHTGERPYVCMYQNCNKAFSNSSDRAKHFRTHQDTKPYACGVPICPKRYTDPSSLRKHMRSHTQAEQQIRKKLKANRDVMGKGADMTSLLTVSKLSNSPMSAAAQQQDIFDGMHFGANAQYANQGNVNMAQINVMMQRGTMHDEQIRMGGGTVYTESQQPQYHMQQQPQQQQPQPQLQQPQQQYNRPPPAYPGLSTSMPSAVPTSTAPMHQQQSVMYGQWTDGDEQWRAWQQQQQQQQQQHMATQPEAQQQQQPPPYYPGNAAPLSCAQEAALAAQGVTDQGYANMTVRQLSPRQLNITLDDNIPYLTPDTQLQAAYKIEDTTGQEMYGGFVDEHGVLQHTAVERCNSRLSAHAQPVFSVDGGGM